MKYLQASLLALNPTQTISKNRIQPNLLLDVETGKFIDSNPEADIFFNLSRDQFALLGPLNLGPKIIYPPLELKAHVQQLIESALAGGNPVLQWEFLNKEGKRNPCDVMLVRFPPYDRSLVRFIFQDQREQSVAQKKISHQAALLKNVTDAIISTDADFKIQYWNKAAETLYGWTQEEVVGKVFSDIASPIYPDSSKEEFQAEFIKNGKWKGEIITQNKNNKKLHIGASVKLIFDTSGLPISTIAIHHDITEHKKAQESLRISEEKFSNVFEYNANIMMLVDLEQMMILEVNQAYVKKMGYAKEEILNKAGKLGFSLADTRLKSPLKDIYRKNGKLSNANINLTTKEGKVIRGLVFIEPIKINGDNCQIVTVVDLTALKAAEDSLSSVQEEVVKLNRKHHLALQSAQIGIWDWDLLTNDFVWDDMMYKMYGLKRGEVDLDIEIWKNTLHPDDIDQAEQALQEAFAGKDQIKSEARIIWPDKSIRYIRSRAILLRNEAGQPIRMIGTNWDFTKEKEIEQEKVHRALLETKNKELEQFAYIASHDMREPIRTIVSFVGLLKKRHSQNLDQAAKEYLEFIFLAANRMNKLVKGLLHYSQLGINNEVSKVDCQSVIQNVLEDLNVLINEKKAVIKVNHLPSILGYETALRILFQNLITNAIKFAKPDTPPIINIEASYEGASWVFSVADNGIGIEAEYYHKVFEIFQRLNPREQYKGTGIGLAHCQKITELHGGKIWLKSELGKGSVFYVSFPSAFFQKEPIT